MTDITTIIEEMKTFALQTFYNQPIITIIVQIVITILVTRGFIKFMLYWHNLHELNKQLRKEQKTLLREITTLRRRQDVIFVLGYGMPAPDELELIVEINTQNWRPDQQLKQAVYEMDAVMVQPGEHAGYWRLFGERQPQPQETAQ